MKVRQCKKPGCLKLIPFTEGKYCDQHKDTEKERYREYKRVRVDREFNDFYSNKKWLKVRDNRRNHFFNICLMCLLFNGNGTVQEESNVVHHITELKEDFTKAFDNNNLICLCNKCHTYVHKMYNKLNNEDKETFKRKLRQLIVKFDMVYYGIETP